MTDTSTDTSSVEGGEVIISSPYGTPLWKFQEQCVDKLRAQLFALIGDEM